MNSNVSSYNCDDCDKSFTQGNHSKRHKRTHRSVISYKCDDCESTFRDGNSFKQHQRAHTVGFLYKFDNSDNSSATKTDDFKQIQLIYTRVKQFECKVFKVKFREKKCLKRQQLISSTYQCTNRETSFKTVDNFEIYQRKHVQVKLFYCQICKRKFQSKNYLTQHKQNHLGLETFKGEMCNKQFGLISTFNKHKWHYVGVKTYF